ncbi:universal stress protein [Nocardia bhagyanarayanae]|uniref:Nucleotide-binding universal stress UspA family protein n=1 Tax=Nocardia bhagyanarayanae TaxID=1215925 RepID=A0A543FDP2_9NOCA|nr:universal stress protein [Nocardia bhagyanarayanae]TQM31988.1 nucleotide-binding universal stress UspA family protein [Nocardia bhagyanarayanae]
MTRFAYQQSIVVGVDGSRSALAAARWAGAVAAREGVRLVVLSIVPTIDYRITAAIVADADILPTLRFVAKKHAAAAVDAVRADQPDLEITQTVVEGVPGDELVEASATALLLVVAATADDRITTLLLGSTALRVANKAHCPVVVWRGDVDKPLPDDRPVLVGVDGSPGGEAAVGRAFEMAALLGVRVVALHAWNDPDLLQWTPVPDAWEVLAQQEQKLLSERLAGWSSQFPDLQVEKLVLQSPATRALLEHGADAQLVVTGSQGRNRLTGLLLGSTSQNLLHHAPCPVLVARAAS